MKFIVTGGSGFIGSAVVRYLINVCEYEVVNIDKLTYAGSLSSLSDIEGSDLYSFEKVDICNQPEIERILNQFQPDIIMHLAAETHVDRSINDPSIFIQSNVFGTFSMLEATRKYWLDLTRNHPDKEARFRFHHISTDEVYGDLEQTDAFFTEDTSYSPSSPYSASKAGSDHLVRAWHRTFKLPVVITNCSNNYGPYQYPEKLIPFVILNAIKGEPIPVYGKGDQIRDWLYVEDHAHALIKVALEGRSGETYNIGGNNQKTNLEVVKTVCKILDNLLAQHPENIRKYEELITFVKDRPGHDYRYAIDASKIYNELGWTPNEIFETGIKKTVEWYIANAD